MLVKRVIFWEPSVSPHKTDFINELACQRPGLEVFYIAQTEVGSDRKELGWFVDDNFLFKKIVNPDKHLINKIINEEVNYTVHIFSGIRHVPIIKIALNEVLRQNAFFGIMSEPRVDEGIAGIFRLLQSWISEFFIRSRVKFVLGIGRHGPKWFIKAGYSNKKIYPFAYFVNSKNGCPDVLMADKKNEKKIIFVGRLIEMKGVAVLLAAISKLKNSANLVIVGGGADENKYKKLASELKINVQFLGVRPISEIQGLIKDCSCLVLPSLTKDDGWGVVVSEALLVGTPVVVSDRVGSSLVTNHHFNGVAVKSGSISDLAEGIDAVLDRPNNSIEKSQRITWAHDHLSAQAGARYLLAIIDYVCKIGPRPVDFFD